MLFGNRPRQKLTCCARFAKLFAFLLGTIVERKDMQVLDYEVWLDEEDPIPRSGAAEEKRVRTSQTSATIADLRPSTRYICQVRALNSCGWSPWSLPSIACTKSDKDETHAAHAATNLGEAAGQDRPSSDKVSSRLLQAAEDAPLCRASGCLPFGKVDSQPTASPRMSLASCSWFQAPTPWRVRQRLLRRLHSPTENSPASSEDKPEIHESQDAAIV